MSEITYQKAGVDPDKADAILDSFSKFLKTRPKDPRILSGIGPYASCYSIKDLIEEMQDPLLVTSCDGVGTKVKLALDWNHLEDLGQDLVGMNVNDLLCVGAHPRLFLDYYACGKLDSLQLTTLLKSIQLAVEKAGCSLVGGETAEMPGLYQDRDFDLAGFTVGMVDRKNVLGPEKVRPGDSLVGIASSGAHSNGYSLIRKLVEKEKLEPHTKTPFSSLTWSEVLLAPTTLYVLPLLEVLGKVSALAHITGGGLMGNLPRVLPPFTMAHVEKKAWPFPPLFQWIQKTASLGEEEMLSTFNCGVGMIVVLPSKNVDTVLEHIEGEGLRAFVIGKVVPSSKEEPQVQWA